MKEGIQITMITNLTQLMKLFVRVDGNQGMGLSFSLRDHLTGNRMETRVNKVLQ